MPGILFPPRVETRRVFGELNIHQLYVLLLLLVGKLVVSSRGRAGPSWKSPRARRGHGIQAGATGRAVEGPASPPQAQPLWVKVDRLGRPHSGTGTQREAALLKAAVRDFCLSLPSPFIPTL